MHPECQAGNHRLFKVRGESFCERRGCDINPPKPGSDAAADTGCTCARTDNGYGQGYQAAPGREVFFVITEGCPLHTPGLGGAA